MFKNEHKIYLNSDGYATEEITKKLFGITIYKYTMQSKNLKDLEDFEKPKIKRNKIGFKNENQS